ncbi:AAA family ATPase [Pseudarthrobacter sp. Y6]|uniref:AAA family ATPase n=1 Tax=Pseudarthrobacter sp. Y6 TaxID=3418422 RepID=UPI003CEF2F23
MADQKLESFRELLSRLDLFTETLNRRFHRKRVFFREDRSLAIEGSSGRMLSVANLSSGEQHELILTKYLLFDAKPNALVLIDEPEISLHVAWQKAFLDDLQSFSSVSNVRFIIATHSPQIINNSWHLTQALGDPE